MRDLSKFALIYSHNGYWRKNRGGYTNDISRAGIYDRAEAEQIAAGCGPEKGIQLCPVDDGHPVIVAEERDELRAEVERLRAIGPRVDVWPSAEMTIAIDVNERGTLDATVWVCGKRIGFCSGANTVLQALGAAGCYITSNLGITDKSRAPIDFKTAIRLFVKEIEGAQ